jgi:hypothetical protein
MAGLVSDAELAALGEIVEQGMQTPVTVLRMTEVTREDSDPQRVWTEILETKGWLWEPPEFPTGGDVGGVAGTANAHLLRLPLGTDAHTGDRIGVNGDLFEVLDDNSSDTYQTYLRLALRRVE